MNIWWSTHGSVVLVCREWTTSERRIISAINEEKNSYVRREDDKFRFLWKFGKKVISVILYSIGKYYLCWNRTANVTQRISLLIQNWPTCRMGVRNRSYYWAKFPLIHGDCVHQLADFDVCSFTERISVMFIRSQNAKCQLGQTLAVGCSHPRISYRGSTDFNSCSSFIRTCLSGSVKHKQPPTICIYIEN